MRINNFNKSIDYIPIVSTFTGLAKICRGYHGIHKTDQAAKKTIEQIGQNHSIQGDEKFARETQKRAIKSCNKEIVRGIIALFPLVGNIFLFIKDMKERRKPPSIPMGDL